MITLIIAGLAIAVLALGIFIVVLWKRMSQSESEVQSNAESQSAKIPANIQPHVPIQTEIQEKTPTVPSKFSIPKPDIPPNSRIELLTEYYTKLPGIIGSMISDRFGQAIAVDTDLYLDIISTPAYIVEVLSLSKHDKLSIGKTKRVLLLGEGSYWIIGELVTLSFALWFERDIPVTDGLEIFRDFEVNLANSLKHYYTNIW